MGDHERRLKRQTIGDRRIHGDRRHVDNNDYNGVEHRSGKQRRTLIDRRNLY